MILQEMSQITKDSLNTAIIKLSNEIYTTINKCSEFKAYLDGILDEELAALLPGPSGGNVGYSAETISYIRTFGVALLNMKEAFNNTTKTGVGSPTFIINIMKKPLGN